MLEIRQTKVLRGPNVWARVPVVHLVVDLGELQDRPTNMIPEFTERLIDVLPSLEDHTCSLGRRGGFIERLQKGT